MMFVEICSSNFEPRSVPDTLHAPTNLSYSTVNRRIRAGLLLRWSGGHWLTVSRWLRSHVHASLLVYSPVFPQSRFELAFPSWKEKVKCTRQARLLFRPLSGQPWADTSGRLWAACESGLRGHQWNPAGVSQVASVSARDGVAMEVSPEGFSAFQKGSRCDGSSLGVGVRRTGWTRGVRWGRQPYILLKRLLFFEVVCFF